MSRYRTSLLVTAILVLLVLGGLLALGAGYCAATLHVPRRSTPQPPGAVTVSLTTRDQIGLQAWWFATKQTSHRCVLVLHGISDSKTGSAGFAPLFLAQGYSVLAPDSRAHGESGGSLVTYGLREKEDVLAWAHWLQQQGCRQIYGLGESLGASVLIQAAALEPVFDALVAECPYARLQQMAEYRLQQQIPLPGVLSYPLAFSVVQTGLLYARFFHQLDFRQVAPLDSMRVSTTPTLLIHGLQDRQTPPEESRQLAAVRPQGTSLWLVPRGGHTNAFAIAPDEFRNRVLDWFEGKRL